MRCVTVDQSPLPELPKTFRSHSEGPKLAVAAPTGSFAVGNVFATRYIICAQLVECL